MNPICCHTVLAFRLDEGDDGYSIISIWIEVADFGFFHHTFIYSFHTVFISVLKSYRILHHARVNGRPIRYENISDSNESDTV